ncbi:hypothetical protein [Leisingera sp. ANG-S5]|uniref:hypothetical protein n=1 Tax=Leisingera sp. ANG-S5 TaxID=1577901 RepID=UPI00057FA215|nr:hypothetical protein [Leisingera sp. ANG-S5]KIC28158.1 hypothetical protein RA25_21610 [Leisingera sp. ANG-S5]
MIIRTRDRKPLIDRAGLYGEFASEMVSGTKLHADISDRAAYMYITGTYPSHLRGKATAILRQISRNFRKPVSLDRRTGNRRIEDDAVRDLRLNSHAMVQAVRDKIRLGYLIEPSRGFGTRRGYSRIFMFRLQPDNTICDRITVTVQGAVKSGWD